MLNPFILELNNIHLQDVIYTHEEYLAFIDEIPKEYHEAFIAKAEYWDWKYTEYFLLKNSDILNDRTCLFKIVSLVKKQMIVDIHPDIQTFLFKQNEKTLPFKEHIYQVITTHSTWSVIGLAEAFKNSKEIPTEHEVIELLVQRFQESITPDVQSWNIIFSRYLNASKTTCDTWMPLFNHLEFYDYIIKYNQNVRLVPYIHKSNIFQQNEKDYKRSYQKIFQNNLDSIPLFCTTLINTSFKDAVIPMMFYCYNHYKKSIVALDFFVRHYFPERIQAWKQEYVHILTREQNTEGKDGLKMLGDVLNFCFNIPEDILSFYEVLDMEDDVLPSYMEDLYKRRSQPSDEIALMM